MSFRSFVFRPLRRIRGSVARRSFASGFGPVRLCLDWTPNTNHSGIYAAQHNGYFKEEGIDIEIVQPAMGEQLTPGRKVSRGMAEFAISSSESAISFATSSNPEDTPLVAVAAILQGSTSSICTLEGSGIDRPRDLDGRRYASYDGRFEDAIVKQMVINDGGKGDVVFHSLDFHGYADDTTMSEGSVISSYLKDGRSDSTWIFTHWEAVKARREGTKLNLFKLEDYGIPYGYSPVLLTSVEISEKQNKMVESVLKAMDKGHKFVAENPYMAAEILIKEANHPSLSNFDFVEMSQQNIGDKYLIGDVDGDEGEWGVMDSSRWEKWVDFLFEHKIITNREGNPIPRNAVDVSKLFTNAYLPS